MMMAKELLGIPLFLMKKFNTINPREINVTRIESHFVLDETFYTHVYFETAKWHFLEACYTLENNARIVKATEFLELDTNFWNCC